MRVLETDYVGHENLIRYFLHVIIFYKMGNKGCDPSTRDVYKPKSKTNISDSKLKIAPNRFGVPFLVAVDEK